MKRTIIFISLLLIAVIYFNCNSSTTGPGNNNTTFKISGKIQSWTLGNKTLKVLANYNYILTSSTIDTFGNFTINLPGVPDSLLTTTSYISDSICNFQVTVIPSNLKYSYSYFSVYDGSSLIGYISKDSGIQMQSGYKQLEYYYYNNPGSINGTMYCHSSGSTATYAINFQKGWDYVSITSDSISNYYSKYHLNSTDTSGLSWNFHP